MTDLDDLRFDTLDRAHDSLLALATAGDAGRRAASLSLLAQTAPPRLGEALADIASDTDLDAPARTLALQGATRAGASLAPQDYRALLWEAAHALFRPTPPAPVARFVEPAAVLQAAVTPALVVNALAWLEGLPNLYVVRLLEALLPEAGRVPTRILTALVERWRAELPDAHEGCDLQIALALANEHPEALDVLERHWRPRASYKEPDFDDAMARVPELARRLRDVPGLRESALRELVGPSGALADALGELRFAHRLRGTVLLRNAHARCPAGGRDDALERRYGRALAHLESWEHGAVVAGHLAREGSLAPSVERDVASAWLAADPPAARPWLESRLRDEDDVEHRRALARLLTREAPCEGRGPLLRLLDDRDEAVRAEALRALDRRSDGPDWVATLRCLATSPCEAGGAARHCLLRRSDPDAVAPLVGRAADERPEARGPRHDALWQLSHAPGAIREHRALFERALRELAGSRAPGAEGLAWRVAAGLGRALGEAARPAVLRAYLEAPHGGLLADDLRHLVVEERLLEPRAPAVR